MLLSMQPKKRRVPVSGSVADAVNNTPKRLREDLEPTTEVSKQQERHTHFNKHKQCSVGLSLAAIVTTVLCLWHCCFACPSG